MKNASLLVSFVLLLGCAPPVEPAVSGGEVDGEALTAAMVDFADRSKFPGLSTCVFTAEQTDWCGAVGLLDPTGDAAVTPDTAFLLASVSKMITAAATMQAVEANLIDLDAPVAEHADFDLAHPSGAAITARQLLQHSAAIADNDAAMDGYYTDGADPDMSLDRAVRRYFDPAGADYDAAANFADRAPGASFDYSNMGVALAGWLIGQATGSSFDTNTATELFGPLGLETTSWWLSDFEDGELAMPTEWVNNAWEPYGHYSFADYPNGGLRSSAADLARFGRMLLGGGSVDGTRVLAESSVDQMTNADLSDGDEGLVGLGWFTLPWYDEGWGGHDGGEAGAATGLYLNRSLGVGVLYLANGDGESDDALYELEDLLVATAEAIAE
jgi:CubicO group peptidase (beta-lactamase class C family)